jgi:transcriptional regulator with XRE-family HTH domain
MPGRSAETLGSRIATARSARSLSQQNLMVLSGVSLSMIRKIEQGTRWPSDTLLQAIADAVGVTPEYLLDGPGRSNGRVHLHMDAIRTAIATYDMPHDGPVRPLNAIAADVARTVDQRVNSQYLRIAEVAPDLLGELARTVAKPSTTEEQRRAAALLAAAYRSADAVAYKHGYRDLSARLVELIRWSAGPPTSRTTPSSPQLPPTSAPKRTSLRGPSLPG